MPVDVAAAAKTILDALSTQAKASFSGVIGDIDKDVIPTMAMLAQNLAIVGARLESGEYQQQDAADEIAAQVDAAASVLVRFTNEVLSEIQALLNALLNAVSGVVNKAVGVALL